MKKNAGFTLVELIVVIAILAILAGIAIPVYSGYISKANEAADLTALDSLKTAAVFAVTEKAVPGSATIQTITATTDANGKVTGVAYTLKSGETSSATAADILAYTGDIVLKSDTFKANGAKWQATTNKWEKNS